MTRPQPPAGLSRRHPAWLIATWFGTGLSPKMPGTFASLAALPFAWIIHWRFGAAGLALAGVLAFAAGLWACGKLVAAERFEDPSHVVIDEVAGQWFTLAPLAVVAPSPDPLFYLAGFALFRLFDITKPWPVHWAERRLKGGVGIMADDLLAAIYAGAGTAYIYVYARGLISFS